MKKEDLEKLGLSKEQVDGVLGLNDADMRPLQNDLQKAQDDLKVSQEKVNATEAALKKFEGVDMEAVNKQISDLKEDLKKKDADHQKEIADRDFSDLLKEGIAGAKGKNARAITALLDVETLKASKNQKEDIAAALKALAEAEDSRMLFGEPEPNPVGTGNPIGTVRNTNIPKGGTLKDAIAEHYNKQ